MSKISRDNFQMLLQATGDRQRAKNLLLLAENDNEKQTIEDYIESKDKEIVNIINSMKDEPLIIPESQRFYFEYDDSKFDSTLENQKETTAQQKK